MKYLIKTSGLCLLAACVVFVSVRMSAAQVQVETRAYAGQPFGVGMVTLRDNRLLGRFPTEDFAIHLTDLEGRTHYPVLSTGPVRQWLQQRLQSRRRLTLYFLFRGDAPLDMRLSAGRTYQWTLSPRHDDFGFQRMLADWWREYTAQLRQLSRRGEGLNVVENYLGNTLARRLSLPTPNLGDANPNSGELNQALGILLGTESVRLAIQKNRVLEVERRDEVANLPLPDSPFPEPLEELPLPRRVEVEPLATHVPVECFYLRFGSYKNFQWFRSGLERWGGDFRNLVTLRPVDYGLNQRVQGQLALRETALSKLLGNTVISDVAVVGFDPFLREGAAMGVLFEARSNLALRQSLQSQRQEFLDNSPEATQSMEMVAGREVSFLSSPDHQLRSYYAEDGDYHLITNCRYLVERFFECSNDGRSLAASTDFQAARERYPVSRNANVFVYLPREFFQNLMSPAYRVEMSRRLSAVVDLDLAMMARWNAEAEKVADTTLTGLVNSGFLPSNFFVRPDGGQVDLTDHPDLPYRDSLRGPKGFFVPIPDVVVESVTPQEHAAYEEFLAENRELLNRLEPVTICVHREVLHESDEEHLSIRVEAANLLPQNQDLFTRRLGAPVTRAFEPASHDVVFGQISLKGQTDQEGEYLLFGGLSDWPLLATLEAESFYLADFLADLQPVGYAGAVPVPGMLRWLEGPFTAPPDVPGLTRGRLGTWLLRDGAYTMASFQRGLMVAALEGLTWQDGLAPAHVRFQIRDLSRSPLGETVARLAWNRASRATQANEQLLRQFTDQLRIPPEKAKAAAESLLQAKLVCPLGGTYQLAPAGGGQPRWQSTVWKTNGRGPNAFPDFDVPLLTWFRGLEASSRLEEASLSVDAELYYQRPSKLTNAP